MATIVVAELLLENEATALGANPSTLDHFQSVEGVSGSQHDDFIFGANRLSSFYATSRGTTGSILTDFDLISGLRTLVESFDPAATSFTGEILLGGAGSDVIKGGWGDEIIDADAWLNVEIAIYDPFDPTHSGAPLEVSRQHRGVPGRDLQGRDDEHQPARHRARDPLHAARR